MLDDDAKPGGKFKGDPFSFARHMGLTRTHSDSGSNQIYLREIQGRESRRRTEGKREKENVRWNGSDR